MLLKRNIVTGCANMIKLVAWMGLLKINFLVYIIKSNSLIKLTQVIYFGYIL